MSLDSALIDQVKKILLEFGFSQFSGTVKVFCQVLNFP